MLRDAFEKRYPGTSEGVLALRQAAVALCERHLEQGLADKNGLTRMCSEDDATYWQQISEVIFANELSKIGLKPGHPGAGPDFMLEHNGKRIWIEVICPEPAGIPADWLQNEPGRTYSLPHEAILLRWTAALKEKAEKLIGGVATPSAGYLGKGIVGSEDAYVVAINGRLLRGRFPSLEGISTFPFAVEATFSLGPYELKLNRETLETMKAGHQHRPHILKPNGAQVPSDTFLDPRFAPISAIWAVDADENALRDRDVPMVVVHNPIATTPLPQGIMPAHSEFTAVASGAEYRLECVNGRLVTGGT